MSEQISFQEMIISYVDINTYDWKEVSWTPGTGDSLDFVIPSTASCSDEPGYEYIWIVLHNLSGSAITLTDFKVTRTAL